MENRRQVGPTSTIVRHEDTVPDQPCRDAWPNPHVPSAGRSRNGGAAALASRCPNSQQHQAPSPPTHACRDEPPHRPQPNAKSDTPTATAAGFLVHPAQRPAAVLQTVHRRFGFPWAHGKPWAAVVLDIRVQIAVVDNAAGAPPHPIRHLQIRIDRPTVPTQAA